MTVNFYSLALLHWLIISSKLVYKLGWPLSQLSIGFEWNAFNMVLEQSFQRLLDEAPSFLLLPIVINALIPFETLCYGSQVYLSIWMALAEGR